MIKENPPHQRSSPQGILTDALAENAGGDWLD
jgi:hypothetical protein